MNKSLLGVKSIGFDLDNTLYLPNNEIDNLIRTLVAGKILEKIPELGSIDRAREFYEERLKESGSGSNVLRMVGYEDYKGAMYECVSSPEAIDLLKKDSNLVRILNELHDRFELFLLTASPRDLSLRKLKNLGINPDTFDIRVYGDTRDDCVKADGSIYRYFLSNSSHLPQEHLYVGDSIKTDILPAKAVGMKTVLVHSGKTGEEDFSMDSIYEVEKLLRP